MTIGSIIVSVLFAVIAFTLVALIFKYWASIVKFVGEVKYEMTKVAWPSKQEVINSTMLVGVSAFILTMIVWGVDLVIGRIIQIFI